MFQANKSCDPSKHSCQDWSCMAMQGKQGINLYETKAVLSQLHLRHLIGTVVVAFEMDG